MGNHPVYVKQPKEYWTYNSLADEFMPSMDHIQFVPGVVVGVVTGRDSDKYEGVLKRISSIRALPHLGSHSIKKKSMVGEEGRYYPLFRGMQETPTLGDPVLLCEIGGEQYYLGPLNTKGNPNFNEDKFGDDEIRSGQELGQDPTVSSKTKAFVEQDYMRMQKLRNNILDNPINPDGELSKTIHGDLIFEGRHGNSIRIGSRNINPYIIISNSRRQENPTETTLDGTIFGIFKQGTIRDHFNMDKNDDGEKYEFQLADDEIDKPKRSISKTFTTSLGRGLVDKPENQDPDINETIYGYSDNQVLLSSDRITFNSRKDSMFLSSLKHIHLGSGDTMTFSTSNCILMEAATAVRTNTPLFKVNSDTVYIDGRTTIMLGDPTLGDNPNHAVVGDGLVMMLVTLISSIKTLAMATSSAIENRAKPGGSVKMMQKVQKELDNILGRDSEGIPAALRKQILSDRVFLTKW